MATIEERVAALETEVAALRQAGAALRSRVDSLEAWAARARALLVAFLHKTLNRPPQQGEL